jgi:pimeloyl-ACP methyl ester carboxylesterase
MTRRWKIVLVALAVVAILLVVNTVVTDRETTPANADGGQIVDLPGGDLHVREDGSPDSPPILLIHGWLGSVNWWDRLTALLERRFHVVRVDLLGHGGSAKPRDGYSMEAQADRVAAALERRGVSRATVVGHSTGGEVAIALAARHRRLVRRLVVIGTEPDERYVNTDLTTELSLKPVIGEALARLATDGAIRRGLGEAFRNGFDVPEQFVHDFKKLTYTAYKKTFNESAEYVDDGRLARDLRSVRVPRLIVFGEDDRLVDPAAATVYRADFHVPVMLIPNAGHAPFVDQPVATARAATAFERRRFP